MMVNRINNLIEKHLYTKDRQSRILKKIMNKLEQVDISDFTFQYSIVNCLKKIDNEVIINEIGMADMPLIVYLLYLKYHGEIKLIPIEQDCIIRAGELNVANMSYLAVYIHFIDVRDNCLYIEGNVSQPAVFKERCGFGIKNNGNEIQCNFYERNMDLKQGANIYETRTVYTARIPLTLDMNEIVFSNYIDENECIYGKINAMRFSPVADCINHQYCVRDGWLLYIEKNKLYCKKADNNEIQHYEELFQEELRCRSVSNVEWILSLRKEYFDKIKDKKKPIWLFMDRVDRADDNAEVLYRYVKDNKEIDSYFIIKKDTKDYERLKDLGGIVEANSREHLQLVLQADYMISSQANGIVENPFWDNAEYFRDLYHQEKIVFLQHGVIKDNMSMTLNRYNTNFTGFVTSSIREWKSIIDYPYYYEEKNVWLTGLPRFDLLYNNPQKYIVIMPSWRQGLMCQQWDEEKNTMVWKVKKDFIRSEYVRKYCSLIRNEKLQQTCRKYGYKLVFMPHALMEPYIDNFMQKCDCIYWNSEKSYREAFAEGNLLITDYSSVVFDFAYLQKPVLYYQFDKEKFFAEHTYKEGYFDYEKDGFGEVAYTEKEIVQLIINYIRNDCTLHDEYRERIMNTFAYHDQKCCERVYDFLLKG